MIVSKKVRKAVIPAAGFGTRLFPATKVVKKELFPIVDRDGRTKPVIMAIVEEAVNAGIEEVGIVVQEEDRELFTEFFQSPPSPQLWQKLSPENRQYSEYIQALGDRVTILIQAKQEGYGHAVFCAKEWVDNEPFLLLLGDHVYTSNTNISCAQQVINAYQQTGKNTIALTVMLSDIIHKAGCVTGSWQDADLVLEITQIYEKPSLDYAREHLRVEGLQENEFLGVFGMYVLESTIFSLLAEDIKNNTRYKGEFQLTTCLERLRKIEGAIGFLVKGQYFDTGMPLFYRQTMIDFYGN
ncbi:MAG: sugar phosphate nucleotidyltransferase [Xenococcaceae cyanobacterium MO_188.B29]|nr:sugar phosphate nucleotidyltransferase [Xenococcaceae cyanobacterium MO_188.B29]